MTDVRRVFFKDDEDGFTTAGAAVALLLVFALMFAGMRAFWVGTRSGDVQYVADAGALAADDVVAEFVTAGQVVDAVLLSMSLLGLTVYVASAVAAFIPGGQGVAAKLADVGGRILKLKNSFARTAVKGLNAAQKALPALCAVRAASCVEANARASGMSYYGFALPFPLKADDVALPDTSGVDEAAEDIEDEEAEVEKKVAQQEKLQEQQDAAKRRAWKADCGSDGMSMRERAGHLAGLSGAANPDYASWETWKFSVALARAKAYYRARQDNEPGAASSGSPELVGESVARKRFYAYALETVSKGSVGRSKHGAELPRLEYLARNTAQIRETSLYTESIYPVSAKGGKRTLHAYAGCPGCAEGAAAGTASVSAVDSGACARCEYCKFSATTLGRVPAASTSIDNGFEYYYRIVVEEAGNYREAVEREEKLRDDLEDARGTMVEALKKALESVAGARYDPQPPGRYGCVCIVYAQGAAVPSSSFTAASGDLPARVAISGAALAADPASDQGNVVAQVGANLLPQEAFGSGLVKTVFGVWGTALQVYTDGNKGLVDLLKTTLGAIPVVGNDLSDWAVSGFTDTVKAAGLEPAKLETYKPVLVNTSHIASKDGGTAAQVLLKLKAAGQAYGDASVGDLEALAATLELPDEVGELLSGDGLTIAGIDLGGFGLGGNAGTLTLPAPQDLASRYADVLARAHGR